MRLLGIILFALSLAGCASSGSEPGDTSRSNPTKAQASAKIHTELAAAYYERAQYGIALDEIRQSLQADSDYAPAYTVRGLIYMALREDQQAEDNFRRSLRLDDKNSDAHNNYGWFLCQRGKERESIPQFLAALKDPLYATPGKAYVNAGICSKKVGNAKDAEDFMQKALVVQPNMPEALVGLADLSFASGDYAGAKSYFLRFMQGNDVALSAENLWLAVRIERKLGDRNSEESYALQLRKRYPDSRETQLLKYAQ